MARFRLGVIGNGKHARRSHIEVGEDFEVTALFDPSPESIAAMQKLVGGDVPSYETEAELLVCDGVDAVLIASPDKDHARQLLLAVQAGKHVLCEKPIAISPEDIDLMEDALQLADANDLVVASCHPRRSQISDLAYGWVSEHLPNLIEQFGPLERVWLSSIYPRPSQGWKQDRSFLLDKYVHDIDVLLRWLSQGEYEAESTMDSYDHYGVKGMLSGVSFECVGTRLHRADDDFIEVILLGFARGNKGRSRCAIYSKTGRIRFYDGTSGRQWEEHITPMESEGYDRVFVELMRNFAESIRGGQRMHTLDELRVINASAVALAGPAGSYRSA